MLTRWDEEAKFNSMDIIEGLNGEKLRMTAWPITFTLLLQQRD
jgi:hypothetical protein